ncbi:LysR family transcriptional regulator [Polaromonas sp. LjRoot131]|uniref:LysR family transcriptional regulator n=1 Tax=Polaromonas sp. LjRoot131 TaxID=3342262 RepID=UPI003ECE9043
MDKLDSMAVLVAVVQEGGFAAAARRLSLSPSVVTRAVGDLEKMLNVRLLTRSTRMVKVTEAGERYAQDCQRVLGELEEVEKAASGAHLSVKGKLVISASTMYGKIKVNTVVLEYLRRYPEAEIECRYVDRQVNLLNEGVDIAIRIGDLPDSSYHATPLSSARRVVCASPEYVSRHGMPRQPRDLMNHRVISALGLEPGTRWKFQDHLTALQIPVKPRLSTTCNEQAISAAIESVGVARLLSYMVEKHLAQGSLIELLPEFAPPSVPIQALQRQGILTSRKVRAFIDVAIECLRKSPPADGRLDASVKLPPQEYRASQNAKRPLPMRSDPGRGEEH